MQFVEKHPGYGLGDNLVVCLVPEHASGHEDQIHLAQSGRRVADDGGGRGDIGDVVDQRVDINDDPQRVEFLGSGGEAGFVAADEHHATQTARHEQAEDGPSEVGRSAHHHRRLGHSHCVVHLASVHVRLFISWRPSRIPCSWRIARPSGSCVGRAWDAGAPARDVGKGRRRRCNRGRPGPEWRATRAGGGT